MPEAWKKARWISWLILAILILLVKLLKDGLGEREFSQGEAI